MFSDVRAFSLAKAIASRSEAQANATTSTQIGDGHGRTLYAVNNIQMSENTTAARQCLTVRMDKKTHAFSLDPNPADVNSIAWACFDDAINQSGWASLEVYTTDDAVGVPLAVRAFAAGLVEGVLTYTRLNEFHKNVKDLLLKDTGTGGALAAADRVIRMALIAWEEYAGTDAGLEPAGDIQRQAWAAMLQLRGIRDGYNIIMTQTAPDNTADLLSMYQLLLMNMHAELPAVVELYSRSMQAAVLQTSPGASAAPGGSYSWARSAAHQAKGSAIVRRLGPKQEPEDLLAGHVTFADYGEMTRVMKHYNLYFGTLVNKMSMSSYPGCISSTDDYLVTDRGLVAMSTSLFVPATGEYSIPATTNEGLPAFVRSLMATRLATQPRLWAKVYGFIPGIAGAKQWLLADYSKLKERQPIANDTVWLVESLPRVQRAGDVSQVVAESGFFAAYGVPHYAQIREIFGLPRAGPGSYLQHQQSALVDKGATINSLSAARAILAETTTSRGAGQTPIAARSDLLASGATPAGAIDTKVSSKCLVRAMAIQARSGPPEEPGQGNFSWTTAGGQDVFPSWPHQGLPNEWNFEYVTAFPGRLQSPVSPSDAECTPADSLA